MALEHTARGAAQRREASSGPATLFETGPRDRPSRELCGEVLPPALKGVLLRAVGQNEAWESRTSAAHGTEWR